MKLPENLRDNLKIPLGVLIPDKKINSVTISAHIVNASYVISVGDRTTEKLIEFGIVPNLQIVDNQEKRFSRDSPTIPPGTTEIKCENPAAEITEESIAKIKEAFSSPNPIRLTIIGEEDLLVIPVCIYAPENSVVLYGQPNEGMVIVHVDGDIRHKTQTLLDMMN